MTKKRISFLKKEHLEERARMHTERRKRRRQATMAKKEERSKVVSGLEDELAKATAKNERLLHLARKYYTKWQTLHRLQRVTWSFYVPYMKIIII